MQLHFRCGRQMHNHLRQICVGFCVPKIIKIGSFFDEGIQETIMIASFWTTVHLNVHTAVILCMYVCVTVGDVTSCH